MANTGNTQQQIDYGAAANDGQGDPLRTAFIKTDDNFDNIWLAGPVGSNITIVNNTVQSNNTNGNIVLRPNGVGVVQANAAIVPNATNLRDLGTANLRWRAAYVGTGGLSVDGNVTVTGNLTAGNISYTGNVFVGDLQGSVYADDSTIMVDAVDNAMFADSVNVSNVNITNRFSANLAGNVWNISNATMQFPTGATWFSDNETGDEYIQSAVDGYINLSTFDSNSDVSSVVQIEHGIIDILFFNGGSKQFRFDDTGNFTLPADGNVVSTGDVQGRSTTTVPLSFANLVATAGSRAFISDGNLAAVGNFGAQISGGGSNTVPVWSDGTNWYVG